MKRSKDPDQISLKSKKGLWLRFLKIFPKCRLPWLFLGLYIFLEVAFVNIGLDETEYTAELFAGNTAIIVKLIAIILLNVLLSNLVIFVSGVTSARINRNMRNTVLKKVLKLPMSFFKDENPREAVYRIVQNAIVIDSTIMLVILPLATAGYKAFSIFGRIFKYDIRLSIILLASIPLQLLLAFLFGRINYFVARRSAELHSGLTQKLAEIVTNIPLAKAFAREKRAAANAEELVSRLYRLNIKSAWLDEFKDFSGALIHMLQALVMVLIAAALLRNNEITTRTWVTFYLFSASFTGSITELCIYWNNLKIIQGGADWICDTLNAVEENDKGTPCGQLSGDIFVENLSFGYLEEVHVFEGISCTFHDNCATALLGVSGCGKTTLINLISRLYTPTSGSISIRGSNVSAYALQDYRSNFVLISQNSMLFSGTVRENVCYGNGKVSDEALTEALKQAGAYDFVTALPNGVDEMLGEYGGTLSGGQKQRLAVARALLSNAHYLVFDEPTAAMDAVMTAELFELLNKLSKERCLIVIAHTPQVLRYVDRVVVLEHSNKALEGTVDGLIDHSKFLFDFVNGIGEEAAE